MWRPIDTWAEGANLVADDVGFEIRNIDGSVRAHRWEPEVPNNPNWGENLAVEWRTVPVLLHKPSTGFL